MIIKFKSWIVCLWVQQINLRISTVLKNYNTLFFDLNIPCSYDPHGFNGKTRASRKLFND